MWSNDNHSADTQNPCLQINCNGNNYNVNNLEGLPLVEKIKSIARENVINKYDIFDNTNTKISPMEVENGEFTGPLRIIRFNEAAA